jgi:hypothetical protein
MAHRFLQSSASWNASSLYTESKIDEEAFKQAEAPVEVRSQGVSGRGWQR